MSDFSAILRRRAAVHEVGHALLAATLGIPVQSVFVATGADSGSGLTRFNSDSPGRGTRERLIIDVAGEVAEAIVRGDDPSDLFGTPLDAVRLELKYPGAFDDILAVHEHGIESDEYGIAKGLLCFAVFDELDPVKTLAQTLAVAYEILSREDLERHATELLANPAWLPTAPKRPGLALTVAPDAFRVDDAPTEPT